MVVVEPTPALCLSLSLTLALSLTLTLTGLLLGDRRQGECEGALRGRVHRGCHEQGRTQLGRECRYGEGYICIAVLGSAKLIRVRVTLV